MSGEHLPGLTLDTGRTARREFVSLEIGGYRDYELPRTRPAAITARWPSW